MKKSFKKWVSPIHIGDDLPDIPLMLRAGLVRSCGRCRPRGKRRGALHQESARWPRRDPRSRFAGAGRMRKRTSASREPVAGNLGFVLLMRLAVGEVAAAAWPLPTSDRARCESPAGGQRAYPSV